MSPEANDPAISFGPFGLYPAQQLLLENEQPVVLGSRALDILIALVERAGELVTKEELVARAWPNVTVDESNLRAQVAALRKVLRDGRDGARYVATVAGRGYRFVAPVSGAAATPPRSDRERPFELPVRITEPVGRADVVGKIAARLQRRRFLTIVGPGGIGKTTVALAVAGELSEAYPDGICFVDLAPLADRRLVAGALTTALGVASVSGDPTPAAVAFLRGRRMLIVLDSCEHVVEAAAVLAEQVLKGAVDVHVLATSREPLRAEGESVQRLAPLEVPPTSVGLTSAGALTFSAVQLFAERAAACLDDFALSDEDAASVAEICRRLDGIALAIELVAGRVDAFGVAGIAAQLDDRFRLLTRGRRTALPRHQTLSAALDWSYEFLAEAERVILRRLAVFAGGFTMESACAVAADAGIAESDLIDDVASLVAKSLVALDSSGPTTIYRLLDTTRAYALAKLVDSGERDRIARRHAEHLLAVMRRASDERERSSKRSGWLAIYGRQIDNVRAALDWAFSPGGDTAIGVALTMAALPVWFELQLIEECFGRVEQALESARSGSTQDDPAGHAAQLLGALGRALVMGFAPEAIAAFARALELAERHGDTENQLGMLFGLWTCHYLSAEHRAALTLGEKFYKLAETSTEPADRYIGDRLLGISLHYLGEQTRARRHLERLLGDYVPPANRPSIRHQSDPRVLARAVLARVLWLQGLPDQAAIAAQRTVEDARSAGHPIWVFSALALAECPIALLNGDLATAERSVSAMLDLVDQHGLGPWKAASAAFDGALRIARDELENGVDLLRAGLSELLQSARWPVDPLLLGALAGALDRTGSAAEGLAVIDDALERCERREERWCSAELLRGKAELLLRQRAANAEEYLHRSLDQARQQAALSWELRSATSLTRLWRDQGRSAEARELLAPVYGRFREGLATADLVAAKQLLDELA